MNAIIFYYSSGGSTARVAEGLGQAMGCEVRRLGVSGKPGPGAILAAMTGMGARLTADTDLRLDGRDAVVLMTPVWAGAPAQGPLRSWPSWPAARARWRSAWSSCPLTAKAPAASARLCWASTSLKKPPTR